MINLQEKGKLLTVADIYSGAGGLSAGFERANRSIDNQEEGYEVVYGVDRDKDAIETFRKFHFPNLNQEQLEIVAPCKDIEDITPESIVEAISPHKKVDVLVGGPRNHIYV